MPLAGILTPKMSHQIVVFLASSKATAITVSLSRWTAGSSGRLSTRGLRQQAIDASQRYRFQASRSESSDSNHLFAQALSALT